MSQRASKRANEGVCLCRKSEKERKEEEEEEEVGLESRVAWLAGCLVDWTG